eukprot:363781-Chlamydomonas_euryale.AAC.8
MPAASSGAPASPALQAALHGAAMGVQPMLLPPSGDPVSLSIMDDGFDVLSAAAVPGRIAGVDAGGNSSGGDDGDGAGGNGPPAPGANGEDTSGSGNGGGLGVVSIVLAVAVAALVLAGAIAALVVWRRSAAARTLSAHPIGYASSGGGAAGGGRSSVWRSVGGWRSAEDQPCASACGVDGEALGKPPPTRGSLMWSTSNPVFNNMPMNATAAGCGGGGDGARAIVGGLSEPRKAALPALSICTLHSIDVTPLEAASVLPAHAECIGVFGRSIGGRPLEAQSPAAAISPPASERGTSGGASGVALLLARAGSACSWGAGSQSSEGSVGGTSSGNGAQTGRCVGGDPAVGSFVGGDPAAAAVGAAHVVPQRNSAMPPSLLPQPLPHAQQARPQPVMQLMVPPEPVAMAAAAAAPRGAAQLLSLTPPCVPAPPATCAVGACPTTAALAPLAEHVDSLPTQSNAPAGQGTSGHSRGMSRPVGPPLELGMASSASTAIAAPSCTSATTKPPHALHAPLVRATSLATSVSQMLKASASTSAAAAVGAAKAAAVAQALPQRCTADGILGSGTPPATPGSCQWVCSALLGDAAARTSAGPPPPGCASSS